MRFHTVVQRAGKTATGIHVPDDVVAELGSGKRPAVTMMINGFTYRSTVAVMGGRFMVALSAENRAGAGVEGDDEIDVDIDLDTEPREVSVPEDFAAALAEHPSAQAAFTALSFSNKSRLTTGIEAAKAPETRQRRIDKAIAELSA
ncbi:hypothetical protein GY21_08035 [Cryobacterium roopkundense]|uniref:Uncharacterized protein n=1 Tax=Cryobacterium roopkundense TaxID=1001240 RepID=A0A099JIN2_9MICO|nr:YdeI/OmpD-associated family protein [Cryobacterium roopkundense]KGJ77482.1 hypothetical protein GY21_08035 [Cryobacterium roopkundense]MBB5643353.1 hypothetical protein [Cryobacterium roopkundense]